MGRDADLIDDTLLDAAHGPGHAEEVAAQVLDRFGGRADRIGFYTPYAIADDCLAETIDALRPAGSA